MKRARRMFTVFASLVAVWITAGAPNYQGI